MTSHLAATNDEGEVESLVPEFLHSALYSPSYVEDNADLDNALDTRQVDHTTDDTKSEDDFNADDYLADPLPVAPRSSFFNPAPAYVPFETAKPLRFVASPIKQEVVEQDNFSVYSPAAESAQTSPIISNGSPSRLSKVTSGEAGILRTCRPISPGMTDRELDIEHAAPITEDDDDDDLMILDDPSTAPESARRRWAEYLPYITTPIEDNQDVFVKQEPKAPTPDPLPTLPHQPQLLGRSVARHTEPFEEIMLPNIPRDRPQPSNSKTTPNLAPKAVPDMIALQRQMLTKKAQSRGASGLHSVLHKATKPTPNNPKKRRREGQLVTDDPASVDAAMRDGDEDHSWMDEKGDDEEDEECKDLQKKIDALRTKEQNGKINGREKLELFKLRKNVAVRHRLGAAARGEGRSAGREEESLFVANDCEDDIVHQHRRQRPNEDHSPSPERVEEETGKRRPRKKVADEVAFLTMLQQELDGNGLEGVPPENALNDKPRKQRKKPGSRPKNAREFHQRERERNNEKIIRKKARQAGGRKQGKEGKQDKGAGKGVKGAKNGGAREKAPDVHANFGRGRQDGHDDIGQLILEELMDHDPISERINDPVFNTGPEPAIFVQTKQSQFEQLMMNVPHGSNGAQARDDQKRLTQASKAFGYAKVKAKDGKWLVKGMRSPLYHHQLLGAQWMVTRELALSAPYGGLLADSMGLGKTVQTLACMVGNPPTEGDIKRNVKATLIVCPSAVITQWMDEIRNHAEEKTFPKIMRYKASSHIPMPVLQDLDIVVTSYHEVMSQFPFPDKKGREDIASMGYQNWWKSASETLGDLHRVRWYRVVLDEAHAIKNNSARTSLACQSLKSVYRWCLTGTPILNRLEELFPYLRFLKADYSMNWDTFRRHFCDPHADDCHQRIATLLSYTMMRRTMKTTILNRPIISLPTPHPMIQYVDFSAQERIIYRITENRFRSNLNTYFAKTRGDSRMNYTLIFVQLLRLRQCTSHPFMLERTIKESWTSEDLNELRRRFARLHKTNGDTPFYKQCKVWVSHSEADRRNQAAIEKGDKPPEMLEVMPFGRGDYGHRFRIDKALATLKSEALYERVICAICSDFPTQPNVTDCEHIFCKQCINDFMHSRVAGYEDTVFPCPSCDVLFTTIKPYRGFQYSDDEDMSWQDSPDPSASGNNKRQKTNSRAQCSNQPPSKGRDMMGFEPKTKESTWISMSDHDPNFPLTPSAKTTALKAILLKGFNDAPCDKVVIYVQFRSLARIVGRICKSEGWEFLYLTGDASLEHRSNVIRMFREKDVKILIAGLKCGGLGLNFPWANRCISLDLWWNHAVEQQAFGRIFRMGQDKETHMTRVVVRNTVDMRLLSMQLHKLQTCERVMSENEKAKRPALELNDLARLFGFLRTSADGAILGIEADYDDDDDGEGEGDNADGEGSGSADGNGHGPEPVGGEHKEVVVELD